MEKALEIIKERVRNEVEAVAFWHDKAREAYGNDFPRTHKNELYTNLWRQSFIRRDILFEILAEAENVPISEIISKYGYPTIK